MVEVLCRPVRLSLRRARLVCAVMAVVGCAALGASVFWNLHAWYITPGRDSWLVGLHDGELVVSWASVDLEVSDAATETAGLSFEAEERDGRSVSLAWRPYHLAEQAGFHLDDLYNGVAMPLWLVALPAAVGAAYLHGRVVGAHAEK